VGSRTETACRGFPCGHRELELQLCGSVIYTLSCASVTTFRTIARNCWYGYHNSNGYPFTLRFFLSFPPGSFPRSSSVPIGSILPLKAGLLSGPITVFLDAFGEPKACPFNTELWCTGTRRHFCHPIDRGDRAPCITLTTAGDITYTRRSIAIASK